MTPTDKPLAERLDHHVFTLSNMRIFMSFDDWEGISTDLLLAAARLREKEPVGEDVREVREALHHLNERAFGAGNDASVTVGTERLCILIDAYRATLTQPIEGEVTQSLLKQVADSLAVAEREGAPAFSLMLTVDEARSLAALSGAGEKELREAARAVLDNADRPGSRMHFEADGDVWVDHKEVDQKVLDRLEKALATLTSPNPQGEGL